MIRAMSGDEASILDKAREILARFGAEADAECLRRARQLLDLGDPAGVLTWHKVRAVLVELQDLWPGGSPRN